MLRDETERGIILIASPHISHRAAFLSMMSHHFAIALVGLHTSERIFEKTLEPDISKSLLHYQPHAIPVFDTKLPEFNHNHIDLTGIIGKSFSNIPQMTKLFNQNEPFNVVTIKNTFPRIPVVAEKNWRNKNDR